MAFGPADVASDGGGHNSSTGGGQSVGGASAGGMGIGGGVPGTARSRRSPVTCELMHHLALRSSSAGEILNDSAQVSH